MTRATMERARGRERRLGPDELLVSKTDRKGRITYANQAFCRLAAYTEDELLGKAHSIVRHPDMPRCVFKLLWDTIQRGDEIFAYVKNLASDGAFYWVLAHVTPTFDERGEITGYHSNRRAPSRAALAAVGPIYQALLEEEARHRDPRSAAEAGVRMLGAVLAEKGLSYDEFIFSLATE